LTISVSQSKTHNPHLPIESTKIAKDPPQGMPCDTREQIECLHALLRVSLELRKIAFSKARKLKHVLMSSAMYSTGVAPSSSWVGTAILKVQMQRFGSNQFNLGRSQHTIVLMQQKLTSMCVSDKLKTA